MNKNIFIGIFIILTFCTSFASAEIITNAISGFNMNGNINGAEYSILNITEIFGNNTKMSNNITVSTNKFPGPMMVLENTYRFNHSQLEDLIYDKYFENASLKIIGEIHSGIEILQTNFSSGAGSSGISISPIGYWSSFNRSEYNSSETSNYYSAYSFTTLNMRSFIGAMRGFRADLRFRNLANISEMASAATTIQGVDILMPDPEFVEGRFTGVSVTGQRMHTFMFGRDAAYTAYGENKELFYGLFDAEEMESDDSGIVIDLTVDTSDVDNNNPEITIINAEIIGEELDTTNIISTSTPIGIINQEIYDAIEPSIILWNGTNYLNYTGEENITVLQNQYDMVLIGYDFKFSDIYIYMKSTPYESHNIDFIYPNTTNCSHFYPSDTTHGLLYSGVIKLNYNNMLNWNKCNRNGLEKYWVALNRTNYVASGNTIINKIYISNPNNEVFKWDNTGDITVKNINGKSGLLFDSDITSSGSYDQLILGIPIDNNYTQSNAISVSSGFDTILAVGTPNIIDKVYYDNISVSYDITSIINTTSNSTIIMDLDDSVLYIGNSENFTRTSLYFDIPSSADILSLFYYCNQTNNWNALSIIDDTTNGMTNDGVIYFTNPSDRGECYQDLNGINFTDNTARNYIAIQRTKNNIGTSPIIKKIDISGSSTQMIIASEYIKLSPTDTPPSCDINMLGANYFDISEDFICICISSGWARADDGTACT